MYAHRRINAFPQSTVNNSVTHRNALAILYLWIRLTPLMQLHWLYSLGKPLFLVNHAHDYLITWLVPSKGNVAYTSKTGCSCHANTINMQLSETCSKLWGKINNYLLWQDFNGRAKMSDGGANALPCPPLATPMVPGVPNVSYHIIPCVLYIIIII